MQLETKAFGSIEIDETKAVKMTESMPGFDGLKSFVVLDPDPENPFKWFQSVDDPDICFLVTDPRKFFPDYQVKIQLAALPDLELAEEGDAVIAVIVNLGGDPSKMTANLRAPIIFNLAKNLCRQVILDNADYKVRTPLFPAGLGEDKG
jgi:flagellar assembly factor FliW